MRENRVKRAMRADGAAQRQPVDALGIIDTP